MSLEDEIMFIYNEVKEKGLQEKFDKQIVLNSVFLKWNNVQKDFKKLVNNFTGN